MVTVPVGVIVEGAVKTPLDVIVPADELQVTEGCPEALKICMPLRATVTVNGEIVMGPPVDVGFNVMVETAVLVPSAALVAVTFTTVWLATVAGAEYVIGLPEVELAALSDPVAGLSVQLTPRF